MRVGIFGSKDWDNYADFMRAVTVFIQDSHDIGHDNITFVHSNSKGAEIMINEYVNKTQKFLRSKNFKIKEEYMRRDAQIIKDMNVIESGLDFALVFTTGCKRTIACEKILKEYNVPFREIKGS